MTAPLFTFDAKLSFADPNSLLLSGTVSGDFTKAELFTNDGSNIDLGSPQVANGEWTLTVPLGDLPADTGFTLKATDSSAAVASFDSGYGVISGITDHPYTTMQVVSQGTSSFDFTMFDGNGDLMYDGSSTTAGDVSTVVETNHALNTPFVFLDDAPSVVQTIANFRVFGRYHDTLVLPSSDFTSLVQVMQNTTMSNGSATIHDPNNSTTSLTLANVTRAQMIAHPHEFVLHGTGQFF